jgi:transcriptional regulator with XRE-family HTH domain
MQVPRLRELRERAFLTQAELAEKSGVAETTINRLENGRHGARISTIRKLALALGVPPAELTAREGKAEAA